MELWRETADCGAAVHECVHVKSSAYLRMRVCLHTQSIPHTSVWFLECFCSAELSGIYGILATSFSATLRKRRAEQTEVIRIGSAPVGTTPLRRHSQQNRVQKRAADFSVFIPEPLTELYTSVLLAQLRRPSVETHNACSFPRSFPRGVIKPEQSV